MTVPTREIRHQVPADIVAVLDGEALADGIDRGELIVRILRSHTKKAVHRSRMILRFADGNGSHPDTTRKPSE